MPKRDDIKSVLVIGSGRGFRGVVPARARHEAADTPATPVRTAVHFGRQKINLRPVAASKRDWFTAVNATVGSDDLCFVTPSSTEVIVAQLGACGVPVEEGPVTRLGARGAMTSVYCRDPDGNLIEIATYGESES